MTIAALVAGIVVLATIRGLVELRRHPWPDDEHSSEW